MARDTISTRTLELAGEIVSEGLTELARELEEKRTVLVKLRKAKRSYDALVASEGADDKNEAAI